MLVDDGEMRRAAGSLGALMIAHVGETSLVGRTERLGDGRKTGRVRRIGGHIGLLPVAHGVGKGRACGQFGNGPESASR